MEKGAGARSRCRGVQEKVGGLLVGALTAGQAFWGVSAPGRRFKEMDLVSRTNGSRELLWGCGGMETSCEAIRASPRLLAVCLGDWRGVMQAEEKGLFYYLTAVNEEGASDQGWVLSLSPAPDPSLW